jgi:hypothetical protein
LPWRFHSAVAVSTPHPSDCLSPRDACEHRDRCQSCTGPADAAAACEFDALGRGALVGLCECGDRVVCRCRCAEVGPPHPSVIPVEGSGIVRQEVDAELGLEAVGQRVSQSATADSAAGLTTKALIAKAAGLRPRPGADPVGHAIKTAVVTLARRVQAINAEIGALDTHIESLVKATAPGLLGVYGVGADTAAILLAAAGDNAARIRSEAAWAHLCGVAPIPAGSGKTNGRHRLNPSGNRQANHALWRIVITRLGQGEPRTVAYMQRRLGEGRTKPEVIRALKRYVAREIYQQLPA